MHNHRPWFGFLGLAALVEPNAKDEDLFSPFIAW